MTAASLMDLGYQVNLASNQIDGYVWPRLSPEALS